MATIPLTSRKYLFAAVLTSSAKHWALGNAKTSGTATFMIRLPVVYDQMVQDALDHDMAAIETCTQGLPKVSGSQVEAESNIHGISDSSSKAVGDVQLHVGRKFKKPGKLKNSSSLNFVTC